MSLNKYIQGDPVKLIRQNVFVVPGIRPNIILIEYLDGKILKHLSSLKKQLNNLKHPSWATSFLLHMCERTYQRFTVSLCPGTNIVIGDAHNDSSSYNFVATEITLLRDVLWNSTFAAETGMVFSNRDKINARKLKLNQLITLSDIYDVRYLIINLNISRNKRQND